MTRPYLPPLADFQERFRAKYGREMSPEEKRFFELTEAMLREPAAEEDEEKSA